MATLSATGNRKVQAGFEPLVGGFVRAPHNDLESLHTIAKNNRNVVAILVEPIQGKAAYVFPQTIIYPGCGKSVINMTGC